MNLMNVVIELNGLLMDFYLGIPSVQQGKTGSQVHFQCFGFVYYYHDPERRLELRVRPLAARLFLRAGGFQFQHQEMLASRPVGLVFGSRSWN